ncbi:stage II sporulation protein E [Thermosipho melanesiensis]|uniref:Stage II sporulation E family protein n=2 Tax=Thermosipho melanesiensis TaxID=46541 RepID=A6LLA4_THEM4|nr:PP2C family protein-serine/threonine phosphatase [Thermosipho melanesiensis]ABR30705.1 Stage II sporulation E family protein [Thermosipho melanesiensis BI429]APT73835.1 stage II sporulation protein E [Thermosipho melanesiensis]OOC35774.1 stage II sporulation protein E [Thermosipho melanesiensis]OOC39073.1 stage II sporulation protein E [Thermosipho melanesiensis]OOC39221.1 stage II sporulation protein E [Thermosipho melanesiensis]
MIKKLEEIYLKLLELSKSPKKEYNSKEDLWSLIEQEIDIIQTEFSSYKQELESSTLLIESQLEEISRLYEEISTLFEISKIVASNIETKQILMPILSTLKKAINFKCGIINIDFEGSYSEAIGECPSNLESLVSQIDDDVDIIFKEKCEKLNNESIIYKTISTASNKKMGFILVSGKESGPIFTAGDKKIIESAAQQIGSSIEREIALKEEIERERLNQQIEIARNIQFNFFPKTFPNDENFDSYGESIPAIHVGGDYFDVFMKNDSLYGIVADVSGKGLPASLIMSSLRSAFKSLLESTNGDLLKTVTSLNKMLAYDVGDDKFVTAVFVKLTRDGGLEVINAGHDPLYIVKDKISKINSTSTPIGMFEFMEFEIQKTKLEKNTLIFAYTDGIPEARNINGEEYDFERLERLLSKVYILSAKDIVDNVEKDVFKFSQGALQHDDMTLLAIKYLG